MNRIEYFSEEFVIAYKEHGVPTVPLKNQDRNNTLLGFVSEKFPEILKVCGKNSWEGGALHRLDTDTAGLVVFARSQNFYEKLSAIQKKDGFSKMYIAETSADSLQDCVVSSYFRAYGKGRKLVKAEQNAEKSDNGKCYATKIKKLSSNRYLCEITNGFRHQIRVHLASNNCHIKGDKLYNNDTESYLHLECVGVCWGNFTYTLL